ncbi:MAG: DNA phosphorothioation system sulfurtransferase DndC [Verrucomicrobiales bacterium]
MPAPKKKSSTRKTAKKKAPTRKKAPVAKKVVPEKKTASQPIAGKSTPVSRNHGEASAFQSTGFEATINLLEAEVQELYAADDVPWIIGYSGGKDSTAVLQLIWSAIEKLPPEQYRKPIHVISTDTLVENPIVAAWVANSLEVMRQQAVEKGLPFQPHRLTPVVEDSFWINLIGKGYPAPRHKFRWCTERLKIKPSNTFITNIVKLGGEAILVLGTRKAESSRRASNMEKHERLRVRDRLSPNSSLPGANVYTPVEAWTNDDVWFYLMQRKNPWGYNNRDLLGMYAGASTDGECPLVVDDTTPSCGDSRFGCWVCTLVEKDKSMTAMVQNDAEMEWMQPLLELRNLIDFREDGHARDRKTGETHEVHTKREAFQSPVGEALAEYLIRVSGRPLDELVRDRDWERYLRDFRRLNSGKVQIMADGQREIRGPYVQEARECWLRGLLTAQMAVRLLGPEDVKGIELITFPELEEIRRIWVVDKHELEDRLPVIYREVVGEPYPGRPLDDNLVIGQEEMSELSEICGEDALHYQLTRDLLGLTIQQRNSARRAGIFDRIEKTIQRSYYDSEGDALDRARDLAAQKSTAPKAADESLHPGELKI